MSLKRWKGKNTLLIAIKFCLFIVLTCLPFISITQMIGLETFLDSFENQEYYLSFKDEEGIYTTNTNENKYVIIQKSKHPDFSLDKDDIIIYLTNNYEIACNKVYHVSSIGAIKRYHIRKRDSIGHHVLENQVIGKVINVVENNIWNSISISIWEMSINNLNIKALLTE